MVGHRTSPEADAQDRPRASESSSPVGLTGAPNSTQRSATPSPVSAALIQSKVEGDSPSLPDFGGSEIEDVPMPDATAAKESDTAASTLQGYTIVGEKVNAGTQVAS